MKRTKRIPPRRKTPRRKRPELFPGHKTETLRGAKRSARRAEIFERAGGRCEELIERRYSGYMAVYFERCPNRATEWSHKQHAARKCDCMACGIASCATCHRLKHAGGKPIAVRKRDIKMEVA